MKLTLFINSIFVISLLLATPINAANNIDQIALTKKAEYLYNLANCYGCHTDVKNNGESLAGGRAIESSFGTFYSPNITPDKQTGIGSWTDKQFINAVKHGVSPSPSPYFYYPSFPYISYRGLSDEDVILIKTHIFKQPPIEKENIEHDLNWYVNRSAMSFWDSQVTKPTSEVTNTLIIRGGYIINSLGHCNTCHTPRNGIGQYLLNQKFKGNEEFKAPDISNTSEGIKTWSDDELKLLFTKGSLPNGDEIKGHMAETVINSTQFWSPYDQKAAIAYLRTVH